MVKGLRSFKSAYDVLVLCGLLLLFAVLSLRMAEAPPPQEDKNRPRRSVSSPNPGGWKAWYLLLQRQNVPVQKIEREPRFWPRDVRVLVTGQEYSTEIWTEEEATDALTWVEEGRTLILLTGQTNPLTERLGLDTEPGQTIGTTLFPLQPAPFVQGVDGVQVPGASRFVRAPAQAVAVFADTKPALVVARRGRGTVVAVSDPGIADNAHLARADNARLLTLLVQNYAGPGGRVGFDEYHQGYAASDSFWDAVGQPGQRAAWQLLALSVLLAYSASRRFGLPRPLAARARVSSEYVASLADLYRRAGATSVALEGVYHPFWRGLCRAVSLPEDSPKDEVVTQAARTLGMGDKTLLADRLRGVVETCETKIKAGKLSEHELVSLARELEQLRRELNLGGNERDPARG